MKALILQAVGEKPVFSEVEQPTCGEGEVLIRLGASALNHRDVWITKGMYPGLELPCILGSDGCGEVGAVGKGAQGWLGKSVIVNPGWGWGEDPRVQGKDFSILGMPAAGTFAEYVLSPAQYCHEKPSHLSLAEAAALPLAGVTAWRALCNHGGVKSGDRVLVTGIGGGVALFAMQFAVAKDAFVVVSSSCEAKIAKAQEMGAKGGVLYTEDSWVDDAKALSRGGYDVIVDGAGGSHFGGLVKLLGAAGRLVFYGGTQGKWPSLSPQAMFFKQSSIQGSTMGSPHDFSAMCDLVRDKALKPTVAREFSLDEGSQAFDFLESGSQFGKVVLKH